MSDGLDAMEPHQRKKESQRPITAQSARRWFVLTVDYEDWFHILGSDGPSPGTWDDLVTHVEADTLQLLDLLERYRSRATFFVLGWSGRRSPEMLREIVRRGHYLGTHGYYHHPPNEMSEDEFRDDLVRSIEVIGEATNARVLGYRAPGFGVRNCPFPYLRVLIRCGLLYDSSVFPGIFPRRGQIGAPARPYQPLADDPRFWEIPVSAVQILGIPIAFSGGGFLRLLPNRFIGWAARRVADGGDPVVYYIHPRDICPQECIVRTSRWRRLRYYGGREALLSKLEGVLSYWGTTSAEDYLSETKRISVSSS